MSAADVNSVLEQFSKATSLGKSELSFAGKGLKLDTEEDGECRTPAVATNVSGMGELPWPMRC